jgi:hypothetical protein
MSTCLVPMPTGDTCIRMARPYSSSYWSAACFVAILGIELPNTGRSPAPAMGQERKYRSKSGSNVADRPKAVSQVLQRSSQKPTLGAAKGSTVKTLVYVEAIHEHDGAVAAGASATLGKLSPG